MLPKTWFVPTKATSDDRAPLNTADNEQFDLLSLPTASNFDLTRKRPEADSALGGNPQKELFVPKRIPSERPKDTIPTFFVEVQAFFLARFNF